MSNPLKAFSGAQAAQGAQSGVSGNMSGMIGQIRSFAALIGNRNPQQMVMNLMRQRGIPQADLDAAMQQAQEIARMLR